MTTADAPHGPGAASGPSALGASASALLLALPSWPPPVAPAHCAHCVSDADRSALERPLGEIPPALVSRFVRKVGTTWGSADDLRRMTPRILMLTADHQLDVSRSLVWEKLRWAQWSTWPDAETAAIGTFLEAEFDRLLHVAPRPAHVAHRWLSQVSVGVDDLSGFLAVWHDAMATSAPARPPRTPVAHLVELLTSSPLRPDLPPTIADVFPRNPHAGAQVTAFLTGPGVDEDMHKAVEDLAGTASSRRVNVAAERLRRFRAAVKRATDALAAEQREPVTRGEREYERD